MYPMLDHLVVLVVTPMIFATAAIVGLALLLLISFIFQFCLTLIWFTLAKYRRPVEHPPIIVWGLQGERLPTLFHSLWVVNLVVGNLYRLVHCCPPSYMDLNLLKSVSVAMQDQLLNPQLHLHCQTQASSKLFIFDWFLQEMLPPPPMPSAV